jgi:hypothetical protein
MIFDEPPVECLTSLKIYSEIEGSELRLAARHGLLVEAVGVFEVDVVSLSETIVGELTL